MLLIVDDDPDFLADATHLLTLSRGVLLAGSAEQARNLLATVGDQISVVMVDLNLPGQDGFSFIVDLRSKYPQLPVIAISGVSSLDVLESAKVLGAKEALRKPIDCEWGDAIRRARGPRSRS